MHRKGFAQTYSTSFVVGPGHLWNIVELWAIHGMEMVDETDKPVTFADLCKSFNMLLTPPHTHNHLALKQVFSHPAQFSIVHQTPLGMLQEIYMSEPRYSSTKLTS